MSTKRKTTKSNPSQTVTRKQRKLRTHKIGDQPFHKAPRCKSNFAAKFSFQMKKHGDTHLTLLRAVADDETDHAHSLFLHWAKGKTAPRWPSSFEPVQEVSAMC